MQPIKIPHVHDVTAQFPQRLTPTVVKEGVAFPLSDKDQLAFIGLKNLRQSGDWLLIPATDHPAYAALRLQQYALPWAFDTYPFPGKFTPYAHQKSMFDLGVAGILAGRRLLNFSEMATGKTAGTVWALDALMRMGYINRVLVLTTKSTVSDPWVNTWFDIAPSHSVAGLTGSKTKRQKQIASGNNRVLVANHHAANTLKAELCGWKPDVVVIDEATVIKTATALIHKNTAAICDVAKAVIPLTGTPTANTLLDAHGLMKITKVPGAPSSLTKFKQTFGFPTGPFSMQFFHDAQARIMDMMHPSVTFCKRECIDLPPQVDIFRNVGMSKEQEHAYNDLINDYVHEVKAAGSNTVHTVTAMNAISLMTKLLQVSCGVTIGKDDADQPIELVTHPADKMDELYRAIDQTANKVLIFAPYKAVIRQLTTALEKKYGKGSAVSVTGATNMTDRAHIVATFEDKASPLRIIVAHPQVLALGVTLVAADLTVWFGAIMRTELYLQGRERTSRPGQTAEKTTQLHILCSDIERQLYNKQREKISGQEIMLEHFRALTRQYGLAVTINGRTEEVETTGVDD